MRGAHADSESSQERPRIFQLVSKHSLWVGLCGIIGPSSAHMHGMLMLCHMAPRLGGGSGSNVALSCLTNGFHGVIVVWRGWI